jgi:hypothetical protein
MYAFFAEPPSANGWWNRVWLRTKEGEKKYVNAIALGGILLENHIKVSVYTQSQSRKVSLFECYENIEP